MTDLDELKAALMDALEGSSAPWVIEAVRELIERVEKAEAELAEVPAKTAAWAEQVAEARLAEANALIQKEQGWRDDLNTLLSAVEQALKDYNENGHYLSAETGYVLQGAFDLFSTPPQGEDG